VKVLLVDDSPLYRRMVAGHLHEWGFEVVTLNDGAEAWSLLQEPDSPKLVLLDWVMPKMDGVEVCRKLRERRPGKSYVYTVLLTAKDGRTDLLKAMDAGADDYLVKPFDELELKARLLVGKRILDLQNELIAARESLRYAATHDSLTGLMSRGQVLDTLRRELTRSGRERRPLGIVMVDIDHFKAVNDELGHLFGDETLKEVARRLQSKLRSYDAVGRYGGEEFLLVLPGCCRTSTLRRANEVRSFVGATPIGVSNSERTVTVSMGLAATDGSSVVELGAILGQADAGLYEAKNKGRNRVEYIDSGNAARATSRSAR
jgi:two-component system cell cycle response regulator